MCKEFCEDEEIHSTHSFSETNETRTLDDDHEHDDDDPISSVSKEMQRYYNNNFSSAEVLTCTFQNQ